MTTTAKDIPLGNFTSSLGERRFMIRCDAHLNRMGGIAYTCRKGKMTFVKLGPRVDSNTSEDSPAVYFIERSDILPEALEGATITMLRYGNRQRGTDSRRSFEIIANNTGLRVEDFLAEGGRMKYLKRFMNNAQVEVVDRNGNLITAAKKNKRPGPAPQTDPNSLGAMLQSMQQKASVPTYGDPEEFQTTPEPRPEPEPEPEAEPEYPEFEVDSDEVLPEVFKEMFALAKVGQNILLSGPSGSGKTFLAGKLAEKLNRQFASQSCSAGMSESQLAGWLLPTGDNGKFAYVPSAFVNVYENGGVFLMDEMDAADENTLIFINSALANGVFYLPQRFENPEIKRHEDFVMVGACNTFGLGESDIYSGRTQLDGATLDRFRAGVLVVDYNPEVERKLIDPDVLEWGLRIRSVIKERKLDRIMSTRVMLDFTKQKRELNYGRRQWEKSYLADWTDEERAYLR